MSSRTTTPTDSPQLLGVLVHSDLASQEPVREQASTLSEQFELALREVESGEVSALRKDEAFKRGHYLLLTQKGLSLINLKHAALGPLHIDFVHGAAEYRRKHGGGRKQELCRAIGIKSDFTPRVLDLSAGLGRDAFVLATHGCELTMIERNPIVAALLADALERAQGAEDEVASIAARMMLRRVDALQALESLDASSDTIYFDPMYPERKKSALVKKGMQHLHELVGRDDDSGEVFQAALASGVKRIVVKRPKSAPKLSGLNPDAVVESKNTRYDLYFP